MQVAGVDGDHVYFLVEDHYFGDPVFYAIIDSLLASGEVNSINLTKWLRIEIMKSNR